MMDVQAWAEAYYVKLPVAVRCPECWIETDLESRSETAKFLAKKFLCPLCEIPMEKTEFWPPRFGARIVETKGGSMSG